MKKTILILILLIVATGIIIPVINSQAAPVHITDGIDSCKVKGDCTFCDVMRVVYNIGRFIFSIMVGIAMILFLVSGIGLIFNAGHTETIARNKKLLVNTVVAVSIILLAWLIVNFTIYTLLGEKSGKKLDTNFFNSGQWYKGPDCK